MKNLTDIESIIQSQRWKKPKNHGSSLYSSPVLNSKSPKQQNFEIASKKLQTFNYDSDQEKFGFTARSESRIQEIAKLAIPYKTLTGALVQNIFLKNESTIVPAFPMRDFGSSSSIDPVFETIGPNCAKREEKIDFIKRKSGRTLSNNNFRLPVITSPQSRKRTNPGLHSLK